MAKGFEYDLGSDKIPLNKPFIDIFINIMNAEVSDDPNALNNITWTAQILGTMTLETSDGKIVDKLQDLSLRVNQLIQQHAEIEIESMQTHDDEKIEIIRENSRTVVSIVTRVISRHILRIVCYSFTNGPMKGCGVANPTGLAFKIDKEYATAYRFVKSELQNYGLYDVVEALENDCDLEAPGEYQQAKQRFGAVRRS